jgi:hypothetical protein
LPKTSRRSTLKQDDPEQSRLFIEKAREIGADEEHSAADELLGHLHKKPPEPSGKGKKRSSKVVMLALITLFASAARAQTSDQNLVASFTNMSDASFTVQVIAPPDRVREYAVCKAVWFAEKKNAKNLSLSNPDYGARNVVTPIPNGWIALQATAYLTAPNPDGNPILSVVERASMCRKMWPWYR